MFGLVGADENGLLSPHLPPNTKKIHFLEKHPLVKKIKHYFRLVKKK
jgi:hypothetical protein